MKRKKVLITVGLTNDMILFITDAPKKAIKEWCTLYTQEIADGKNTYLDGLKKKYYVKVLHDSELESNNEDVDVIGYDKAYDLFKFMPER